MDTGGEMAKRLTKERDAQIRKSCEILRRLDGGECSADELLAEIDALRAELLDAHLQITMFRDYFNLARGSIEGAIHWAVKGASETQAMWEKHRRSLEAKP